MGMAASQARYLGLTARKINVEYEGQQVNQQRTALANESAGLFRRLMSLENPVPPSQNAYYENVYTYSDTEATADGKVTIVGTHEIEGSNPPKYSVDVKYNQNVMQYQAAANQVVYTTEVPDKNETYSLHLSNGTAKEITKMDGMAQNLVDELNKVSSTKDNEATDTYYTYTDTLTNSTFYINATKSGFDPTQYNQNQNVTIYSSIQTTQEVNKTLDDVTMIQSASGTFTSMKWYDDSGLLQERTLTPSQEYDEQGYNEAMNQYNVDKANYEQEIASINAKTEELQETDRTLELRLKQLDTEQEALQTELDSVKKVIDKSVDNVFKTFQ